MTVQVLTQVQETQSPSAQKEPLPLFAGDRLSRAEFERRYQAQSEIKKAELIEGVVYMPSPVKHKRHGNPHLYLGGWITTYLASTPNIDGSDNATVRLDNQNEPQPDLLLRIDRAQGGRSFISSDDYIEGAPELIIEIAGTSASYDMHDKKLVYARNGVREYLVVLTYEQTIRWFVLRQGEYEELQPDAAGVLRSECFPGLWLNSKAFWQNDLAGMLATLQEGLATAEHSAFVAGLGEKMDRP
ncbi:MAG: Uma2 family endonuclease [Caldilineaceae bacterium]